LGGINLDRFGFPVVLLVALLAGGFRGGVRVFAAGGGRVRSGFGAVGFGVFLRLFFVAIFLFVGGLVLVFFLLALLVVARGQRRGHVASQRHGGEPGGVGINPGVVQVAVNRREFPSGAEEEVFAVGIEDGQVVVVETAGDLVSLAGAAVVKDDGGVAIVFVGGVGDPAAVGRPAHGEALQFLVIHPELLIQDAVGPGLEVVEPDAHRLVNPDDFFRVGRPLRAVAKTRPQVRERLLGLRVRRPGRRFGRAHRQLVFARAVAEPGDEFAVRRPGRKPLGDAAAAGEVANDAVLGGHGKHLAARFEEHPLAAGRNRRVLDEIRRVLHPGLQRGEVGCDRDFHLPMLFGFEVEQIQPSGVFEDDLLRADAGKVHIEVGEKRHLPEAIPLQVVGPNVEALVRVAIREEIKRAAVPHGDGLRGVGAGEISRLERLEIEEPDVRVHAAAIPFPGAEIHGDRGIGQRAAVGRDRAKFAVGHRQLFRQPALDRHAVELVEPVLVAGHGGREEQMPPVRIPIDHAIRRAVVRDAPGQPAAHRHDVNVLVAVVIAAERELRPVGRKPRKRFLPARRTQAHGLAAGLGREPNVARIHERDVPRRDRRLAHHARVQPRRRVGIFGRGRRKADEQGERRRGKKPLIHTRRAALCRSRAAAASPF
jgi:hypothetical protein